MSFGLNSIHMVLIPNISDAISVKQYRPIVLGNFVFKVCTKTLADCLGLIAYRIIDPHQFGFIKRMTIDDCIAGASKCINVLNTTCHGNNMALKIDIRKAFDTFEWNFVGDVLSFFDFSYTLVGWLQPIFASSCISILF